jgi:hypothetical protein
MAWHSRSRTDDVGRQCHAFGVDPAETGRLLVSSQCQQVATKDRAAHEDGCAGADRQQKEERIRDSEHRAIGIADDRQTSGGDRAERCLEFTESSGLVAREPARQAAIVHQPAQRHDKRLQSSASHQQAVNQTMDHADEHHQGQRRRDGHPLTPSQYIAECVVVEGCARVILQLDAGHTACRVDRYDFLHADPRCGIGQRQLITPALR